MKVDVRNLQVGDEVAYGEYRRNYWGYYLCPDFKFSKVKKIHKTGVTLDDGEILLFNGWVRGTRGDFACDPAKVREDYRLWKQQDNKRRKLDKIQELCNRILHRAGKVDLLDESQLDTILASLQSAYETK